MKMLNHPDFGAIQVSEVFLSVEKPVLFLCSFEKVKVDFIGILVEEYVSPLCADKHVENYYFAGVNKSELRMLKSGGSLKELFNTRPVWWCNSHYRNNKSVNQYWKSQSSISPIYQIADGVSLKC
ncbi:hypothetical protein SEA_WEASELS2_33 [Rhodococcus phage Weasels2]|uniref:Uncharacterized protein n=1 Tax=Rhodococcus phage Weasels2 TaxID=1897437 RepID=A0A1I9SA17_9CAUD|nr:hypothetical protein FDH04_gp033 [Rhodococcus phage Weasels2]AOZ63623.1 hypothetical protein SEA_WEASELS2_33 [Rhodococcus phage Weasels2]